MTIDTLAHVLLCLIALRNDYAAFSDYACDRLTDAERMIPAVYETIRAIAASNGWTFFEDGSVSR